MPQEQNLIDNTTVCDLAIKGGDIALDLARRELDAALAQFGADRPVEYPETAYELPMVFGWDGAEVRTLNDLVPVLDRASAKRRTSGLEGALSAGETLMISAEVIEALRYVPGPRPYEGTDYCGFIPDRVLRSLGLALVDDTIPGVAVLLGRAPDADHLATLVRDLQGKGLLIIAAGDIIEQLKEKGVRTGLDLMLYPVGHGTQVVHALNFAVRAALSFGGVQRGDRERLQAFLLKRVKAFVLQFGTIDEITAGTAFAALLHGIPIVTDQPVEGVPEKLVSQQDMSRMLQTAFELRDIKVKTAKVDVPVAFGPAFEGETVRRPDTFIEAGGAAKTMAYEILRSRPEAEVEDGRIEVIGKDLDEFPEGSSTPIAVLVDVYGKRMLEDFETVLERRIHLYLNFAEGLWHTGQRNIIWMRISKNAFRSGFRLRHIGNILVTKMKEEFGNIISRVQVTIITDAQEIRHHLPDALDVYARRDDRMEDLTDDAVDTFYSCLMCQSFAPDHVCVITPERLGLCGAINWLDARTGKEIVPSGPNQPIPKRATLDVSKGQWEGVNATVTELTRGKIVRINAYSLMEDPMTSCGCFECIVAMTADAQAVIVVNREYPGMTPVGMKFSTLAGSIGGGRQTPGFIGVGRKYLTSKKFISAEGGFLRIAWMPKHLKEALRKDLERRAEELGEKGFVDRIADETVTTDAQGLTDWLVKVDHPVLRMSPLLS